MCDEPCVYLVCVGGCCNCVICNCCDRTDKVKQLTMQRIEAWLKLVMCHVFPLSRVGNGKPCLVGCGWLESVGSFLYHCLVFSCNIMLYGLCTWPGCRWRNTDRCVGRHNWGRGSLVLESGSRHSILSFGVAGMGLVC